MLLESFWVYKGNFICKEKCGTATKVKLVTKIKNLINLIKLYFRTLVLTSYCYCGDNA